MQFRLDTQAFVEQAAIRLALGFWTLCLGFAAQANEITVRIVDDAKRPVGNVVVVLEPASPDVAPDAADSSPAAEVDQLNQRFIPQILAIRTGTQVVFPNSDSVAHQVYSFSPAKRFELGLYRGDPHPPVAFDKPGIVVLGCNIHDNMVGYVYVTDAPYFGTSDATGSWRQDSILPGDYRVRIWSPRLSKKETNIEQSIQISNDIPAPITFALTKPLRALMGQRVTPGAREY